MKKLLFAIIIIINAIDAYSQVQQTWALSHIARLKDQVVDVNGNIYQVSTAYSQQYDTYGTLTIKHDKDGGEVWRHFGPASVETTTMAVDLLGNVYYAGAFVAAVTPQSSVNIGDKAQYYIAKISASGEFLWSNIYTEIEDTYQVYGIPRSIVLDENANPYVTGVLYNSLQSPEDSLTSDYGTVKYDGATGNRIWVKRYNGSNPGTGFDDAKAMTIDAFGNIYVTGTSQLNGYMDIVTLKYDLTGNETWVQRFSNTDPYLKNDYAIPEGIKLDAAANVFVVGSSKPGEDITGDGGNGKRVIIKYTFTGFQLWVRERTIYFFSRGPFIVDNANNIIEASDTESRKYNAAGDLLWTSENYEVLTIDNDNNIYSVSRCLRTDNNLCGTYTGLTTRKHNSNGVLLWEKTYLWYANGGAWIGIDANKNIYSSGSEWLFHLNSGYVTIRYSQCEITCPNNITVNNDPGTCGAVVTFLPTTTSGSCGSEITYSHTSGSTFPVGTTIVTAKSTETGAECSFTITVNDNELPVLTCPGNITINMDPGVCYASVDPGTATATDNCAAIVSWSRSDGLLLTDDYPGGITTITWTANDGVNSVSCDQTITVADFEPPTISNVNVSHSLLSPPNHKMVDVTVNFNSEDNCNSEVCSISVQSSEPVNGTGDGDTDPDWEVIDNNNIRLRAERSAKGDGRFYTITINCIDGSGNRSTEIRKVVVAHNIKSPISGASHKIGSTVNLEGVFWDKPGNTHTATWMVDNTTAKGIVTEPEGLKNGKVTGNYKFSTAGVYKLQMNVKDQHGVTSYANTNGDVDAIVVIYDPNGGNAYGGGWFASPKGALKSDPNATGKVSFGFASSYFKKATSPKGETQMEFKIGALEFNALNFEYLVISNARAQFKGSGRINGDRAGYDFIMTVIDGKIDGIGTDKIRLKIFSKSTGEIIYDNQPGASDADDPKTTVGVGSEIVIITGKKQGINEDQDYITEVNDKFGVKLFPNPTTSSFNLLVNSLDKADVQVKVINSTGQLIKSIKGIAGQTTSFGNELKAGMYFIEVVQGENKQTVKLIKF